MSRRNLAAPRSPIGSIIIPFYLHQGRGGALWGNNSRPKKRYNLPFNRLPSTGRTLVFPFQFDIGIWTGYLFIPFFSYNNRWMERNSFALSTEYRDARDTQTLPQLPSFQFVSITRVDHFFVLTCSHPVWSGLVWSSLVSSRLVSSRHGKHPTSFFTVLRCITIDRSHARHSIRNNSGTHRSTLVENRIDVDLKRSVPLFLSSSIINAGQQTFFEQRFFFPPPSSFQELSRELSREIRRTSENREFRRGIERFV